jgi:ribokinase
MKNPKLVVLLGDLNVDVLFPIQHFPQAGQDRLADHHYIRPGGGIGNIAGILTKLGLHARLIGRVGTDFLGDYELAQLGGAGIDLSAVVRDAEHDTGLTCVPVTPDGERTLLSSRGANNWLAPQDIRPESIENAHSLHLAGYAFLQSPQREAAWKAIHQAQANQALLSVDTGLEPVLQSKKDLLRLLPLLDACILGLEEVKALLGVKSAEEGAEAMLAQGVKLAAIKMGEEGCLLAQADQRCRLPAYKITTVDTTGAGDAFSAGIIYSRLTDLSLGAAAVLASALGGLATNVWGAGPQLPARAELIVFLTGLLQSGPTTGHEIEIREILHALGILEQG